MPLAPSWVPQNMLGLDTTTLVVVVVDTDPSGSEETVADLAGVELDGGSYVRGTADAEVTRIGDAWILLATDVDTFDLSDSDPRAGVWLATAGATDADRALIHYSPDPGAPDPAYTPTWPSGVYDLPIEPIDAILDDHDNRITVLETEGGGGGGGGDIDAPIPWAATSGTYYLDRDRVWLGGMIAWDPTISPIIETLPVGYRPDGIRDFMLPVGSEVGGVPTVAMIPVGIHSDGTVTAVPGPWTPASMAFVFVENVSFRVSDPI